MPGGMTMVGDMFDHALKARVDALCNELAQLLAATTAFSASVTDSQLGIIPANWWPAEFGVPSASGGQNEMRYAVFPSTRRLAIEINGATSVFDTASIESAACNSSRAPDIGQQSSPATSAPSTCRGWLNWVRKQEARASAPPASQYRPAGRRNRRDPRGHRRFR
jgi:hypothetical protein